ncbi:MAG TPA: lamin tail domain-containing protein [Methylomirabilota bacterium]|nr:lamin tail domain-containing protein [Methylomirabilota bacterium]
MTKFVSLIFLCLIFAGAPSSRAAVVINEFLAENDGGLADSDGETPDWIELFNDSAVAVNLAGWHLTDNPTNLTKWTFPATNVSARGFLVVFASGKDRTTNAELHTNFQLDNGGGYLALVNSNGVVVRAFDYPQQHRNVSFGPGSSNAPSATLLANNAAARWFVPVSGALGTSWTAPAFDASTWSNATSPLRYDVGAGGVAGPPVLSVDMNRRNSAEAADTFPGFQSFIMTSNGGPVTVQTTPTTRIYGGISVTLSNSVSGYHDRLRANPVNSGAFTESLLLRDFVFLFDPTGTNSLDVHITGLAANQNHEFTIWSFDSLSPGTRVSDWFANGVLVTNNYTFNGSVLPTDNAQYRFAFRATASAAGVVVLSGRRDVTSTDGANPSYGVFLNALQIAPVSSGFATNGNVAALAGQNSSLFVRESFNVANPALVSEVRLRVKYDDGFVAYLNGTEVARRNAPASPDWNSAATAVHSGAFTEEIVLPGAAALLMAGENVLAMHGLNLSMGDADFLLEPQLVAALAPATNGFYSPVTPGASNGPALNGVVADTKFSVDRGFHDASFSLAITCATPSATIYFTTNGSAPSPANGFVFSSPISIARHSFIRAQAFLAGWVPSGIDTHSYVFLRDVLRQSNNIPGYPTIWQASYPADYAMDPAIVAHPVYGVTISNDLRSIPSLMIVSDHNGLWNASSGIYPNSTSSGVAWERETSVELIAGDGQTEFATTAKIEMHGNASRDNVRTPKHSMRLTFSSEVGPTRLNYDWFGGGVDEHNGIVLRSCGFVDGWAGRYADNGTYVSAETGETFRGLRYRPENTCYLRDVWVKESFRDMGWSASRSAFVHLYINGLYWGLYEPSERLDASYFSLHYGGLENTWDVLVGHDSGGPPVVVDGSVNDWQTVLNLANAGITSEAAYAAITNLVDIDNLIDYMMLHIFAESEDWPHHNWFVAHRRATNGVPGTKFIVSVWDQELTLDRLVRRNRINVNSSGGEVYSPGRVYAQLRAWPEFRRQFGDRVHKHLFNSGALTPSNNVARLLTPAALIRNAIVGESARCGDARKTGVPSGQIGTGVTFTRDEWWQPEIDKLATNFFQHLTADNVARFRAGSLYPTLGAPHFSQFGGNVSNGFTLLMTQTNAGGIIYFTTDGSDPRTYGNGAVTLVAQSYSTPVPINTPTVVRARVLNGVNWSALVEALFVPPQDVSRLALTEIMYHPPDVGLTDGNDYEFVELKNAGTNTLNLLGLTLVDGISFTWTSATLLAPGQFIVLVKNPAAFAAKYPGVTIGGTFGGSLNNAGEKLTLAFSFGGPVFSVTYDDLAPWPVTPDGYGFSLVPINPGFTQAPDDGAKWRASTLVGGSPGADDPAPTTPSIVINEILTHTDLPAVDRIELHNPTLANADIGGWFLTDDVGVPTKYRIPNGTTISAGGFVTFDEAQFNATPGTNNSFSLSSSGDEVYLFSGDANTNLTGYSHGFAFTAAENGVSFGRHLNSAGEEQFPAQVAQTFNAANSGPRVGPVVINEIHYHPALNGDEFVELKNITAAAVPLFDPAHPTNTWRLDGLNFTLPTNLTLPANGLLLLVATNPSAFIAKYPVPTNVTVLGPWAGFLQDSGERLDLKRPDAPETNGVPRIVVDGVRYNDKSPWPPAADGSGPSLQRKLANQYGDEPTNWVAAAPTPGFENAEPDNDGDGMPDSWEIAHGTNPSAPDANDDADGDGFTNLQEYLAGTNPQDPESRLRVTNIVSTGGNLRFEFTAASNRTFTVLFSDSLISGMWSLLSNISAAPQTRTLIISDPATNGSRFYRLAAP